MADENANCNESVTIHPPKTFRLKCPNCQGIMICDESVFDNKQECSDCGHPVDPDLYEPLRKYRDEIEAVKKAKRDRHKQEKDRQQKLQREADQQRKREEALKRQRDEAAQEAEQAANREKERVRKETEIRVVADTEAKQTIVVPTYTALHTAAEWCGFIGVIMFILAGLCFVITIIAAANSGGPAVGILFAGGGLTATLLLWGLLALLIAEAIYAFRDMAINSFKQLVLLQDLASSRED